MRKIITKILQKPKLMAIGFVILVVILIFTAKPGDVAYGLRRPIDMLAGPRQRILSNLELANSQLQNNNCVGAVMAEQEAFDALYDLTFVPGDINKEFIDKLTALSVPTTNCPINPLTEVVDNIAHIMTDFTNWDGSNFAQRLNERRENLRNKLGELNVTDQTQLDYLNNLLLYARDNRATSPLQQAMLLDSLNINQQGQTLPWEYELILICRLRPTTAQCTDEGLTGQLNSLRQLGSAQQIFTEVEKMTNTYHPLIKYNPNEQLQ